MAMLEVDFDVFKELTQRRRDETVTYNDVIRALLGWPARGAPHLGAGGAGTFSEVRGWRTKGVLFPNGTEFRMIYRDVVYFAKVEDEQLMMDGRRMRSPSEASVRIGASLRNGWRHWECRRPGETRWVRIERLREER